MGSGWLAQQVLGRLVVRILQGCLRQLVRLQPRKKVLVSLLPHMMDLLRLLPHKRFLPHMRGAELVLSCMSHNLRGIHMRVWVAGEAARRRKRLVRKMEKPGVPAHRVWEQTHS